MSVGHVNLCKSLDNDLSHAFLVDSVTSKLRSCNSVAVFGYSFYIRNSLEFDLARLGGLFYVNSDILMHTTRNFNMKVGAGVRA